MGITSAARAATNTLEGHPTCGVHADTSTISGVISRFVFGGDHCCGNTVQTVRTGLTMTSTQYAGLTVPHGWLLPEPNP